MKKKLKFIFAILPLAVVLILCIISVCSNSFAKEKEKQDFRQLSEITQIETTETNMTEEKEVEMSLDNESDFVQNTAILSTPNTTFTPQTITHSIRQLMSMNSDCVGWISIPNTDLSYPVMHTPNNSEKYLNMDFYGNYSYSGTPFLDARCSLNSDNLIVYGHHMNDGSMFGTVCNYINEDYRNKRPQIVLETNEGVSSYTVFSVMKAKSNDKWYRFTDCETEKKFNSKVAYAKENSVYETEFTPSYGQQLLTLSTCYGNTKDGRILVVAVKN